MRKRGSVRKELASSVPDVQMEEAAIPVLAGAANLQVLYEGLGWKLPVKFTILTHTRNHRGVHMSRLVEAVQKHNLSRYLEQSLKEICREVDRTQPGCRVFAELQYPYKDQFVNIGIEASADGPLGYVFERIGITACPCSRRIVGIGHMQRALLKLRIVSEEVMDFEEVALKMGECFSSLPQEALKRVDEAKKITEAQLNPKFAEDLVRECLGRFPRAHVIEARCFESIHSHDALAVWSRDKERGYWD